MKVQKIIQSSLFSLCTVAYKYSRLRLFSGNQSKAVVRQMPVFMGFKQKKVRKREGDNLGLRILVTVKDVE